MKCDVHGVEGCQEECCKIWLEKIETLEVVSSTIVTISYLKATNLLEVRFKSDAVYQYQGVPESIFQGLKTAESKGKYFAEFVKNRYSYERIK